MQVLGVHDGPPPDDQDAILGYKLPDGDLVRQFQQNQKNHGSMFKYLVKALVEGP